MKIISLKNTSQFKYLFYVLGFRIAWKKLIIFYWSEYNDKVVIVCLMEQPPYQT